MNRNRWTLLAKFFALFAAGCVPAISLHAQGIQMDWARRYSFDPAKTNQALKIVKAPDGFVVGGSSIGADGKSDYVIIKYKSNGSEAWLRRYSGGAGSDDVLRALIVDPLGNVFATGTSHTVKFTADGTLVWGNPLGGRAILATAYHVYITGFSDTDFATAQLSNDGTGQQIWVQTYDGLAHDRDVSDALGFMKDGSLLVAGHETKTKALPFYGVRPAMLKYTQDGQPISFGPSVNDFTGGINIATVRSLLVDASGFVYSYMRNGNGDRYFACFDSTGAVVGSSFAGYNSLGEMALIGDGAAVIVRDEPREPGGPWQAYVGVCQRDATKIWERKFTSGYPGDSAARGVVVNAEGIYAVGDTPDAAGKADLFVVGYTTNGVLLGSIIYDSGSNKSDFGNSIVSDDSGNIYVTGYSTTPEGGSEFLTARFSKRPPIKAQASGAMEVEFYTEPDQPYAIEWTVDFFNWESLMTNTADGNGVARFVDTSAAGVAKRFYRGKKP